MTRNTKQIRNKLNELEQNLPVGDALKTISEELKLIDKIFKSKDCEDYKEFMRTGNKDAAQSILDKHPANEQELIKDAWMLEVEYGDMFERIAIESLNEPK